MDAPRRASALRMPIQLNRTPTSTAADLRSRGAGADRPPVKIAHVMTVPKSFAFLRGQVGFMRAAGFSLHAIASPGPELDEFGREESVPVHAVKITRAISPLDDLVSLWRLWRVLRSIRPDVVHAHFAKSGMLGMIAATAARVPVRVYHQRSLNYVAYSAPLELALPRG
jgi:hypothetical protein